MPASELPWRLRTLKLAQSAARLGAVIAVPLIVWLSLIPGDMQTRTAMPKTAEHFVAYLLTAACLALALGGRRHLWLMAGSLVGFAGALEVAQTLVPGRTAGLGDFLASGSGAIAGAALTFWLVTRLLDPAQQRESFDALPAADEAGATPAR